MYMRNRKHLLQTERNEDQIIKLSDDEDEAKIVQVKFEGVTNDEERIVEPRERKSEIRKRLARI